MLRRLLFASVGALALISSAAIVACSGDSGSSTDADVINAITIFYGAGLHALDEAINNDKQVPATARTTAQKMQTVLLLTEWPSDLDDDAQTLADTFAELAAVLR